MSRVQTTTNFKDSNGADLGTKLVTKDYLISVYPGIGDKIGIPPELWVWGNATGAFSTVGTLGTNGGATTSTPVTTFAGGSNWKYISIRGRSAAAIKIDGTLWTWGNNSGGILGNAGAVDVSTPVTTFAGGTDWKQVSCGVVNISAIKNDGTLWVWGIGSSGQLGNATTLGNRSTPVTTFAGGNNWKQVSCATNSSRTAAIKTDGTLWIWGSNAQGELGINSLGTRSTPVTTFAGGTNWKQVSGGGVHTAAIKTDGTLWIWGQGSNGQLGNFSTTIASTPVTTFAGGNNWKQVSCGLSHTAAIKTDGTLWIWGSGSLGALGNFSSSVTGRSTPVTTFAGGTNWKQVSAGQNATSAIKTDGTLWIWGSNNSGRLGNAPTTFTSVSTPITTFAGGTNWKETSTSSSVDQSSAIRSVDF